MWVIFPSFIDGEMSAPLDEFGQELREPRGRQPALSWGFRARNDLYNIRSLRIRFFQDFGSVQDQLTELSAIADTLFESLHTVQQWGAILGGQLSADPGDVLSRGTTLRIATTLHPVQSGFGGVQHSLSLGGIVGLKRHQVAEIFDRVSTGQGIPPERQLLLSARAGLFENDFRRSVIDAGTAAEVALATSISRQLKARAVSTSFIESAIINANGVAGLTALAISLGDAVPVSKNRVADRLAKVRNRAAHGGVVPSPDEAHSAYALARTLVDHACPLDIPTDQ
ncbi:hypothetical protein CLV67_1332 [Actinoplanes italicus]|jgi:hypothetical protein|uniref:Apea-like HEPN domain-containing protein n=2 Tax=Actinoplanes italicus TaxID=113567 RepID=A0A2T0JSC3_9ACTN|nr:hypothetical protein CLV67_1332 [Actinoplanes italicus]